MALDLIDKSDNNEIIRDQIAAILVAEVANQKALATAAGKDATLWDLKVYTERANPWEAWLNQVSDQVPRVNIWFENESFDGAAGNVVEQQKANGTFNIDCYGFGLASDNIAGGHYAGDEQAARNVQRAVRLVRNIIMAAENTYLGLRGIVWRRMPQSITIFQPQIDNAAAQEIVGARLALDVGYSEFSPQMAGNALEYVAIDVIRAEDGQIVLEADYSYPLP